jgi:hypothetical protein
MLCYKDRSFCDWYVECVDGWTCPMALTDDVKRGAAIVGLPISHIGLKPECFKGDVKDE